MKALGRIISMLVIGLLVLTGCQQARTKTAPLKKVTTSTATWYLYQKKGTQKVISLQFQKNKTVIVKDIDAIGAPGGENRVDDNFVNPKFKQNKAQTQLTINTSDQKMVLKLGKKYAKTIDQKKMVGYHVTYGTQKNWYLARISEDGSDNGGTAMDTAVSSKKKKATPQPKNITSRLLNFMKDPAAKATPLADQADAGNYIYRILAGKNQAYGQLTLNQDGTYQNAVSIHAAEGVTADDSDKPVVAEYEVSTGHITNLYGKYYLQPDNLLRISYYVHGQNVDKPLPQKITLYTGSNIGLAKARIEHVSDNYLFYSKDYDPWPEETGQATAAITLTKTETSQISLSEIYQAALQQAAVWQTNSISSNADLMQVVATLADNNQDRVGTVGVNFSGSYGVSQQPADYAGVAKDGSAQATMDYVFAVSPANDTSGTAVITTTSGSLLVFGSLKNQLYLLHQPDSNSATVTWQPVKNTALTVTDVRVRLNP